MYSITVDRLFNRLFVIYSCQTTVSWVRIKVMQDQPFSNIRVIDLTHVIAGPFCSYQLAVMGADVIKVEPPDCPDMLRAKKDEFPHGEKGLAPYFMSQNANKRSVSLQLKSKKGREILASLIKTADVFIENYRTGSLANLGLAYSDVKAIKSDIIYCSMTGFGQDGPLAERTAYDNVIQAYSGLMAATGSKESTPVKIGPPILDYGTGIQAAFAISAALYQRTRTGEGQCIDIAMLDSALMLMSSHIAYYNQTNTMVPLAGNNSAHNAGYYCYQTKNGQLMLGAYTGKQVKNMWIVLGQPDRAEKMKNKQPPGMADSLDEDVEIISKLLLTKTATEWEEKFNSKKVPAARVRALDETLDDQQLHTRKVVQSFDKLNQNQKLPVASFKYAHNGPRLTRLPPVFGEHTQELLAELGYEKDQIKKLESEGIIALNKSL